MNNFIDTSGLGILESLELVVLLGIQKPTKEEQQRIKDLYKTAELRNEHCIGLDGGIDNDDKE